MTAQSVTLNLPPALYRRWQRRAQARHRSVEAELLDAVVLNNPESDDLSPELNEALNQLALLDDASLWRVARSHLPEETSSQLETLHLKQQREGLLPEEAETEAALLRQYDRHVLMRSEALALLKQRGATIPAPDQLPTAS